MPRRPGPPSPVQLSATPPPTLVYAREHLKSEIDALVRTGELTRVRRGAYLPTTVLDGAPPHARRRLEQLARVLAVGTQLPSAVVSHASAALWWGLPLVRGSSGAVHVRQPHRPGARRAKDIHRHGHELPDTHVCEHRGIAVTTLERTVVDCAMTMPTESALILADAALHGGASLPECQEILRSLGSRRGTARARAILEFADGGAESPGETRSRLLTLRAGLPRPVTQVPVVLPWVTYWADLGWPEHRLLVEYDGTAKYTANGTAAEAVLREKRREEEIIEAGYRVVRLVRDDLSSVAHLGARLRQLADFGPPVRRRALNTVPRSRS